MFPEKSTLNKNICAKFIINFLKYFVLELVEKKLER